MLQRILRVIGWTRHVSRHFPLLAPDVDRAKQNHRLDKYKSRIDSHSSSRLHLSAEIARLQASQNSPTNLGSDDDSNKTLFW